MGRPLQEMKKQVSSRVACEEQRNRMSGLILLFRGLFFCPQLFDEQPHLFRPGIGKRIFAAKVKKIPEPLPVIGVGSDGNCSLL